MRPILIVLVIVSAISACQAEVPPVRPSPTLPTAPAAAISVDELLASTGGLDGQPIRVKGFILVTPPGASMCSLLLESYPPQCGGGVVRVTGEIPADVAAGLDKTSEPDLAQAMWGWVEATGTFKAADGGSIALSEIRLAAP